MIEWNYTLEYILPVWTNTRDIDSWVMADLEQGEVTWPTIATAACVTRNYNQAVHCSQFKPPQRPDDSTPFHLPQYLSVSFHLHCV